MSEPSPLLKPVLPQTVAPRLWRLEGFVTDPWRAVSDNAPFPVDGRVIVPLSLWRTEQPALLATGLPIGICVQAAETLDAGTDAINDLSLIVLPFPKFTDGRAYSAARRLIEVHRFQGELRATGDILLDQLPLMLRAGFESFEIVDAATILRLEQAALPAIHRVYQRSTSRDAHARLHRFTHGQ
jgi:uncharacterized protein (DUF934 family)